MSNYGPTVEEKENMADATKEALAWCGIRDTVSAR